MPDTPADGTALVTTLYVDRSIGVIECSTGPHSVGVYRSVHDGEWRALCATCDERATEGTMLHRLPTLDRATALEDET